MLSARPSNALLLATIVMSLTSAACVDDDPVDPRTVVPQWTVANLPEDSIRDVPAMVEIAREVPSFGGVYFDDEGQLVIAMTDVTRSMHVERLLQSRLGSHQTKTGVKRGTTVRFATKAVEYSFLELARYKTVLRQVFAIDGVVTLDANERKNRVEIGLADMSVQREIMSLVDALGIPQNAVVFSKAAYPRVNAQITGSSHSVYGQTVVEGGWQIRLSSGRCTLGVSAIRADGDSVFITNSHCTSDKWGFDGDTVWQPENTYDVIGTEILDPVPDVCGWAECRDSDAALFAASKPLRFGKIVRTTDSIDCEECYGSLDVDSTTTSLTITSTLSYVISDESIHKIGKTTGWSYGNVEATCVDVGSAFLPGGDIVLCSDRIDYNAEDGDSGGPAFSVISGTNVQLRGIHWGSDPVTSDGYISNLGQIQIDLGGLTYYDPGSPSVTISGPTQVPGGGVQCTWEANVFDGVRPYTYTWSGLLSGSGSDAGITGPVYNSGTLYVTVTDFFGRQAFGNIGVTVVQGPPVCD